MFLSGTLFVLLISSSLVFSTKWIPKCCSRSGYELATDVFAERALRSDLKCMTIDVSDNTTRPELNPDLFYGLKVNDTGAVSNLPECPFGTKLNLSPIEDKTKFLDTTSSCLDLVNGAYKSVACTGGNVKPKDGQVEVYTLRKCCPVNSIYDVEERMCVGNSNLQKDVPISPFWSDESKDIQVLKSLLNQFDMTKDNIGEPLFYIGAPKCAPNEALVTYQLKSSEFTLRSNRIIPKSFFTNGNLNSLRSEDPFCIDSLAEQESTLNDSADTRQWLVRACHPESICDGIPCVRKCCGHSHMLARVNGTSVCLPFERDLNITFHDLNEVDDSPIVAESKGEKIWWLWTCGSILEIANIFKAEKHLDLATGRRRSRESIFKTL